jgi:hypothetical protein
MHNNLVDSYKYFTIDFRNLKKENNVTLNSNIILVKSVTLSKILLAVNNLSIFRIRIDRIYVDPLPHIPIFGLVIEPQRKI